MTRRWIAAIGTIAMLSACGSATPNSATPNTGAAAPTQDPSSQSTRSPSPRSSSATPTTPTLPPTPTPTPTQVPTNEAAPVTKLLVFMVENHSLDQMRAEMPFTFGLAQRYGYATHYQAITHPSLPNYLAITSGSTHGVTDDQPPSVNGVHGPSVFGQALAMGMTATLYAEGMEGTCATEDGGNRYAVRHNPWAFHLEERAACQAHDVPLTQLADDVAAGRLPNAGMVIPDLCNDAHDCGLGTTDSWLHGQLGTVMSGPDWASGRLAVVVTADEDDHLQDNTVLTVIAHPSLDGVVVDSPLTHYSLARAYSEVLGAPPLAEAAGAQSLLALFDISTRG